MVDFEDIEPFRRQAVMSRLAAQMNALRTGHGGGISPPLIHDIHLLLQDWRSKLKREGIDFPPMHMIALISANVVEIARQDLDRQAVETLVKNICIRHPSVDPMELAVRIHGAYPGFMPDVNIARG